jgi:hypothetical protein
MCQHGKVLILKHVRLFLLMRVFSLGLRQVKLLKLPVTRIIKKVRVIKSRPKVVVANLPRRKIIAKANYRNLSSILVIDSFRVWKIYTVTVPYTILRLDGAKNYFI